jgi:hypothetical protein
MVGYQVMQDLGSVSGTSLPGFGFESVNRLSSSSLSPEARLSLEWEDKAREAKARMVQQYGFLSFLLLLYFWGGLLTG